MKKPTKKYPGGGTVSSTQINKPAGVDTSTPSRAASQYNRMSDRFGDKMARVNARVAALPAGDRKTAMQERATGMNTKFTTRLADFAEKRGYTPPTTAKKGGTMKKATKFGAAMTKQSADTKGRAMKKYAAGGLTAGHKAADGIAKKGKTKGKEVAMKKGGYMKGGKC